MSKALLICPSDRPAVVELSRVAPLAAAPLLGQSLLEYWLTHLALSGITEVHILADDRVDDIKKVVGTGARWGLTVQVTAEVRELTAAQAQIKYAAEFPAAAPNNISVLDHFPGEPNSPIFTSYANLFAGVMRWLPRANTLDRVGFREVKPGIWVGRNAHVSPEAQLTGPCWIGQHVFVGANCVVGPNAILEDRAFIEGGAEIVNSAIGAALAWARVTPVVSATMSIRRTATAPEFRAMTATGPTLVAVRTPSSSISTWGRLKP